MQRRTTLDAALRDVEAGALSKVTRIVVSRAWWDALSDSERDDYQRRSLDGGVELSTDHRISRHFVEVIGEEGEPPLSSESLT